MKKLLVIAGLLTFSLTASAEEYLYILSARAKLLSAPSFSAPTVSDVTKGEKLLSLEKTQRWFRVSYQGKEGWVSRLAVSPHPPMKRVSRLASAETDLSDSSRRRASTVATTAAIRGLREDGRARITDENAADYGMLSKMESFSVTEHDIVAFTEKK